MPSHTSRTRRAALAVGTATVLAVSAGLAIASPAAADPATSPTPSNPFSAAGGFSIYALGDAHFSNHEVEGSVAVGGELTVASSGTFAILHQRAGVADYSIPTVDGDPTRLLIGSYSTRSGAVKISNDGAPTERLAELSGQLKVVERGAPFSARERAGWVRYSTDAATEQGPLIDATNQLWPAAAASIYTAEPDSSVAGYVAASVQADYPGMAACLGVLTSTSGDTAHHLTVAEDNGGRTVLSELDDSKPNVIDYAAIAGTSLLQFRGTTTLGAANPLIIRVPAGTTTVQGLTFDTQFGSSPFVMWDLSALSGAVSISSGARIDGSVYAPDADLTVDASPIDGQIIGKTLALKGGETHAVMFRGTIPCAAISPEPEAPTGGFTVTKSIAGSALAQVPADTDFTVSYALDGTVQPALTLRAGATHTVDELPIGTTVTLSETVLPPIDGISWAEPGWSRDGRAQTGSEISFAVTDDSIVTLVLTNTATATPVKPGPGGEPEQPGTGTGEPGGEGGQNGGEPTAPAENVVNAPATTGIVSGTGEQMTALAATGSNAPPALGAAAMLLLLGAAVLTVRRLRPASSAGRG